MAITEKQKRSRILVVLFLGVLMGALDIAIVGPALPAIQRYFQVGERILAWTFSIYVLFNLIGTPLIAKLSDSYGKRRIYILDVAVFAFGSLIVALSPSFPVLLIGRSIQGLAAGGIFPVASAVIGDTFPAEQRGRALGLIGAVFGLAFLIGPILGGVLLLLGWQWLFIVNLPVAAVVIGLSLRQLPASPPNEEHSVFDWAGMVTLGGSLAALAVGINQIRTDQFFASLTSLVVWPYLVGFVVLLTGFVIIERRAQNPILRLALFRTRQMDLAYFLSAGGGLGEATLVFVPALAVAALGVTSSTASFLLLPFVLAMAVGSPLAGRFLDSAGSRAVLLVGTSLLTIGMVTLGFSGQSLALFILSGIFVALGLSALLGAPLRYIMLNEATLENRSSAQGVLSLFSSIGQLLGGALVGAVVASQGGGIAGYDWAYRVTSGVIVLMIVASFALKSRGVELATIRKNERETFSQEAPVAHTAAK